MQGSKAWQGKLFYQVSLESMLPHEHLVRRMATIIPLGWVRSATANHYSSTGKPSIDPIVIAKMMIIGFLYNIDSERQLMREVQVNLAYRWYLGYDLDEPIPNHSVLSKARRRLGQGFFEQLFTSVLELCRQAGLIDGSNVLIDSTFVKANASTESVTALKYSPKQYWQQLDLTSEPDDDEIADNIQRGHELGSRRPRENRISDQKHSTTDADATLARKGKTSILGYKTHVCADSHKGVITSVTATTAVADDTSAVPQLLDKHRQSIGKPDSMTADGEYGSEDCLAYIQQQGVETVINKRGGGNKYGGYDKNKFIYDSHRDVFVCPARQILKHIRTDRGRNKAIYQCSSVHCGVCVQRQACLGTKSLAVARSVTRFDTPYESRAQAACSSSMGRRLLKLRHTLLEGLFGQAKNFHGLGRARWRGLCNMVIQSLLTATVLNVKKLLSISGRAAVAVGALGVCFFDMILEILGLVVCDFRITAGNSLENSI